jgi:membrane protein YqaA with SNARE-associated domain
LQVTPLLALSVMRTLVQLGPLGEVLLGLLDASVIPTPGGLDILLIILVARKPQLWWLYILSATLGSTIGAYLMFRAGRRIGKEGLEERIPEKRLKRVYEWSEKYGIGAVMVPALLPPPFPLSPFLLAAGAMKVRKRTFIPPYAAARVVRYGIVAWLGHLYGRQLIQGIHHYSKPIIWALSAIGIAGGLAFVGYLLYRKHKGLPVFHSTASKKGVKQTEPVRSVA